MTIYISVIIVLFICAIACYYKFLPPVALAAIVIGAPALILLTPKTHPKVGGDFCGEDITPEEEKSIKAILKTKTSLPTTVRAIHHLLPYRASPFKKRVALHLGQRKLLLVEISFLTDYARKNDTIVYAGAAPSIHTPFLSKLFENLKLKFELYDPRKFRFAKTKGITAHQQLFTNDDAGKWANREDILFMSDIRTGVPGDPDVEKKVAKDMQLQEEWTKIINPRAALLKFRAPYGINKLDSKLAGPLELQPWAPQASSETRLVATRPFKSEQYSPKEYEDKMFYLNAILREWANFDHNIPVEKVKGLDYCFDCAFEIYIWKKYLNFIDPINSDKVDKIADLINLTSEKLSKGLDRGLHGHRGVKEEIRKC